MKKLLLILFTFFIGTFQVYAATTSNGVPIEENESSNDNTFSLYCAYKNEAIYVLINRASTDDNGEIDSSGVPFDNARNETLKKFHFMEDNGNLDCPKYAITNSRDSNSVVEFSNSLESLGDSNVYHYSLDTKKSLCTGKCTGNQNSNDNDYWTCEYTGPSGKLTTKYDGLYLAYFPDGSFTEIDANKISPACPDIFYNKVTHDMEMATYDFAEYIKNHNNFDPTQYDYLCGSNKDNYEYFCSGSCKYPNNAHIDCDSVTEKIVGETKHISNFCNEEEVQASLRFIGYLLLVVKILVPVLLIIFGTIDYFKAVVSSDADAIGKSTKSLILRIIAGVIIFIIPTIINFVFGLLPSNSSIDNINQCRTCVLKPNKCK